MSLTVQQLARLENAGSTPAPELITHVRGDKLRVRQPQTITYDEPPELRGRIDRRDDGSVLTGVIVEAHGQVRYSRGLAVLSATCIVIIAIGIGVMITHGVQGLVTLAIGVVGLIIGLVIWRKLREARRPIFKRQADELESTLQTFLSEGRHHGHRRHGHT